MSKLTDEELLAELHERFQAKQQALHDYQTLVEELGKVNKKLEESESLKGQFLSNIRNEINNPFASILGLSRQILQLDESQWKQVRHVAGLIYAEAFDLDFQLKNIFAAAETEAGEQALQFSKVEVKGLLEEICMAFSHLAAQQHLKLNLSPMLTDGQDLCFCTDPEKLQMIVSNLLSNAIKFSQPQADLPNEKQLNIRYGILDGKLVIEVQDEGIGISTKDQKAIFDRFRQLDNRVTKLHRGHGLGLSVVKGILDMLEGSITVQSDAENGSTFTILLPEASHPTTYSSAGNEFIFDDGEIF